MKMVNYEILGHAFRKISDACFEAAEQEKEGKPVTACGLSEEDIDRLSDIMPYLLNPMMSTEEVKEKLHVSDSTLNRMVQRGDIPRGEHKRFGHTRYWKKWDILHYIRQKKHR